MAIFYKDDLKSSVIINKTGLIMQLSNGSQFIDSPGKSQRGLLIDYIIKNAHNMLLFLLLINFTVSAQSDSFIKGIDISSIPKIQDNGGKYYSGGVETDPLEIFGQNGVGWVRLRLWHTPVDKYSGLESVIEQAVKVKQAGYKLLLDFHYSDTWADPAKQTKPKAWQNLDFNTLSDSVYDYTFRVINSFKTINVLPDMVQLGNEIISGLLWPDGRVGGSYDTDQQWQNFSTLMKRAASAVQNASADSTIKIMIHVDRGGNNNSCRWFYGKLIDYKVPFDAIGLSFYPWWHGTLSNLSYNMNDLAQRFNKYIIVAETGYPWTLQWFDGTTNIVGSAGQLHAGYAASVEGQKSFISDLIDVVKKVPGKKGLGIFYWEPAYISAPRSGSPWENIAMFDFQGNALSSIELFKDVIIDTTDAVNITFRLNTSTNSDTLNTDGFVQIRGETVAGNVIMDEGLELTWDINSAIILNNHEGDCWETTIRMVPGTELRYKYWAGHSKSKPTFQRLGWESSITPYDNSSGNFRKFIAGKKDSVLQIEYFNSNSETRPQYWVPFEENENYIAVKFRVNMTSALNSGRFTEGINGPVGVRGENLNSENILSWDETKLILQKEEYSVNNGSFWSGNLYFPKSFSGLKQKYKFFIENDSDNGWENKINDRVYVIPSQDTTLHWDYFDGAFNITSVESDPAFADIYEMLTNYPNPFNPETKIIFKLLRKSQISLIIYNLLGQKVIKLSDSEKPAGNYELTWNAKDQSGNICPSGIYLLVLKTGYSKIVQKMILTK